LRSNSFRSNLVAIGDSALYNNGLGITAEYHATQNTGIGSKVMFSNTTGYRNTALGYNSLYNNTVGMRNFAAGSYSLFSNIDGNNNTAVGNNSLFSNTSAKRNTANGSQSLTSTTTGSNNTAVGYKALKDNTTGFSNVAVGTNALNKSTVQHNLVAIGDSTLFHNGNGAEISSQATGHTAVGSKALYANTTGSYNTAVGCLSLHDNTDGNYNVALGSSSLPSNTAGEHNVALGYSSMEVNETGSRNIAVGWLSGQSSGLTDLDNTIAIGYMTKTTASNQIRMGDNTITSIGGYANWTNISDVRFKENIAENVTGLDFIMKLRPVTYNLSVEKVDDFLGTPNSLRRDVSIKEAAMQKETILQTGFIAQEVEQAAKSLGYDFSGVDAPKNEKDFYGLRYAEFVVPLVKGMQEQQEMIDQQNKIIQEQNKSIDKQNEKIEELLKKIERLSDSN
jgi:co-chaperonin GroES (HSP10)